MNCPVCRNEARTHLFFCAQCAVYVHKKCWPEHLSQEHQEQQRRTA